MTRKQSDCGNSVPSCLALARGTEVLKQIDVNIIYTYE